MRLPVPPPVEPMLARLADELPVGPSWRYEPKWDGFRCLVFRVGDEVVLQSRKLRPLQAYFPELLAPVRDLGADPLVLDGEILVTRDGVPDFDALLRRIHPGARHAVRLSREAPACFVAFDLLADGTDQRHRPFAERRAALEAVVADDPDCRIRRTPLTDDPELATEWLQLAPARGIDGVVAKDLTLPYRPGRRAMVKVKRRRTADCVVAGARLSDDRSEVVALLLALHDDSGALRHVGVASSFSDRRRTELLTELSPLVTELDGHPWADGFALGGAAGRLAAVSGWWPGRELDWVPLRPELVCEVAYTQVDADGRWRHGVRFLRWRPDRDPRSCTVEQFDQSGDRTAHDEEG